MSESVLEGVLQPLIGRAAWKIDGGGLMRNELEFEFGDARVEREESRDFTRVRTYGEYGLELLGGAWRVTPKPEHAELLPEIRSDMDDTLRRRRIRRTSTLGDLLSVRVERLEANFRIHLDFQRAEVEVDSHTVATWRQEFDENYDEDEWDDADDEDMPEHMTVLQLRTLAGYFEVYHDGTYTPPDRLLDLEDPGSMPPDERRRLWPDFDALQNPLGR